ncbi:isoleucine--tRNA ligase [Eubacteriales bacterium OttesenSCG-928-M02]|nr:isoleucine--tRNA ligase [Eubacteriales bacterium OttesenSCG-928-M02]
MQYDKVSTDMNFSRRELEVLDFWKREKIFEKTLTQREGAEPFGFYDGPPTANGMPHIGHLETRTFKDVFPRYKQMKGYNVLRKAGWDTHGLPVELEVEKQLGLNGKEQIEEYGVEDFIKRCKESVWKYKGEWERMSDRIAFWVDMEHPYITYENDYIESVWWSLKEIDKKGLLYKGHKTVPYCPRCGTALSSHEVAQGYEDVTEDTVVATFPVIGQENTYLLAWTTTPWTLPSNVALCVNAKEEYAYVSSNGKTYLLAKALVPVHFSEEHSTIVKVVTGQDLVGMAYEPLFGFQADWTYPEKRHYVVADNYVTLTDGTGIVHIAPAFGEDDNRLGRTYGLPFVQLVNPKGELTGGTDWDGMFVKDADEHIIQTLKDTDRLFSVLPVEHSYPFCWRCHTPLIYYARSSWFIEMTKVKDQLMQNNRSVNWLPEHIKEGRMGNFIENVVDWGLSRERYWGTPLPVWECACGHREVIGSIEELCQKGIDVPDDIELHKPYIDAVHLTCEACGGKMTRVPEVIDGWYDSGSMPFAQWHYPFENKDMFEKYFPANFISEAIDQTRGWFYTLLAIATCVFDTSSFENCLVLGHVNDKDGRKMSKHLGNVVDPWEFFDKQGADAIRWYFYVSSAPWLPSRFYEDAVNEAQRKFMGTLWNTYAFYVLYADIDGYDPTDATLPQPAYSIMDRWVLSKLHHLVATVTSHLDEYHSTEAARAIGVFVEELSNWYVRRSRERFWASEMDGDKAAAFYTLYTVLNTLSKLIAPFTPFLAESIYQNIVRRVDADAPESVHLCDYPVADAALIDPALMEEMDFVLTVVTNGRSARNAAGIKNRQPLNSMIISGQSMPGEAYQAIILEELNVKSLSMVADASAYIAYQVKPQMRTLGPKYGKVLPKIREYLQNADGTAIVNALREPEDTYAFTVDNTEVVLTKEDVLIDTIQKEGFAAISEGGITVVLDTTLTPALINEGYVRELVSKIQTMRKDAGYNVTDHIRLCLAGDDAVLAAIKDYETELLADVLADTLADALPNGYTQAWDINGKSVTIGIERIG